MPWVTINVQVGHSDDEKRKLHAAVAEAVYTTLNLPPEWVKIQIVEMQPCDHSIGGVMVDKLKE